MNITQNDLSTIRELILDDQNGVCYICGKKPKVACVDHEHVKRIGGSGKVRGVLCSGCNIFLAKSENNSVRYGIARKDLPTILRAMAKYLEKPHYAWIHPTENPKPKKLMKSSYNQLKKVLGRDCPPMSKSGRFTIPLQKAFRLAKIEPKFYK